MLTSTKEYRRMQICFQQAAHFNTALDLIHRLGLRSSPGLPKKASASIVESRPSSAFAPGHISDSLSLQPAMTVASNCSSLADAKLSKLNDSGRTTNITNSVGQHHQSITGESGLRHHLPTPRPSSGLSDVRSMQSVSSTVSQSTMAAHIRPDSAWSLDKPAMLGRLHEVEERSQYTFSKPALPATRPARSALEPSQSMHSFQLESQVRSWTYLYG